MVKKLEILSDGNQRGTELSSQLAHKHPAILLKQLQDRPTPLLTEHFGSQAEASTCPHIHRRKHTG